MKYCRTCEITKDDSEFHFRAASKDGLTAKCKVCQRVYDKLRANEPKRVLAREAYLKTPEGRKKSNEAKLRYRKKNRNKQKAHEVVAYQLKLGNLTKGNCEKCGTNKNIHAHHANYSMPLNINWLCSSCHRHWHKENGPGLNP